MRRIRQMGGIATALAGYVANSTYETELAEFIEENLGRFIKGALCQDLLAIRASFAALKKKGVSRRAIDAYISCGIDVLAPFSESRREIRHTRLLAHFFRELQDYSGVSGVLGILQTGEETFVESLKVGLEKVKYVVNWDHILPGSTRYRDYSKVDISLRSSRGNIVIEAKIDASESQNQTSDYEIAIKGNRDFSGRTRFLFLGLDSTLPSNVDPAKWSPVSWRQLAALLTVATIKEPPRPQIQYLRFWIGSVLTGLYGWPPVTTVPCATDFKRVRELSSFLQDCAKYAGILL